MPDSEVLPENISRINKDGTFSFSCHPRVQCFTECCRLLDLALTPYDVLRLRLGTGLSSEELLEKFIISEQEPGEAFPRLYLSMVDDGKGSCVFVRNSGCSVYAHRPGACRTYPLGRAVMRGETDIKEYFVIIRERHCLGFNETAKHTPKSYTDDQDLILYNQFNDAMLEIFQHQAIRNGFIPSHQDITLFILALYNLDTFRKTLLDDRLHLVHLNSMEKEQLQNDDERLLKFGIALVKKHIFSQVSHLDLQSLK